jgi:hypothetical protein
MTEEGEQSNKEVHMPLKVDTSEYDDVTIENENGTWWVFGHGEYGRGSVLAGQYMRVRITHYQTLEQAQADYPEGRVLEHLSYKPDLNMSEVPPDWFDPLDAGEEW